MGGGEADALDAVNGGHIADKQSQVGNPAIVHLAPIGIHVLPQQVHLANPLGGELGHLGNDVIEGAADFRAPGIGHHAIGAVLGAAFHDGHEGRGPLGPGLGQTIKLLDFGKAHIHHRLAGGAHLLQHGRQAVQGLGAEHQVHVRGAAADGLALLAGYAAAHPDDQARLVLLPVLPTAQQGKHFLLSLFPDGAGIEQQQVGIFRHVHRFQAVGLPEHVLHLAGVVLVHLASEGFDVQLAGHSCSVSKKRQEIV